MIEYVLLPHVITDYMECDLYGYHCAEVYGELRKDGSVTRKVYGKLVFDIPEINMKIYEAKTAIYVVNGRKCSCDPVVGINYRYKIEKLIPDWKERLTEYIEKSRSNMDFTKNLFEVYNEIRSTYEGKITGGWLKTEPPMNMNLFLKNKSTKTIAVTVDVYKMIDMPIDEIRNTLNCDLKLIEEGSYDLVSGYTRITLT